ncbi:MAG: sigma-70 family RNA polymerase sigma factor [Candidatus Eisenbacteria sp.]|nr:sigma-70 family RNA polymerase sigma factor [Candidatus Eisenbacteria bacterium]
MVEENEAGTRDSDQRRYMPLENEYALIRRCQDGDLKAFEALYYHYETPMLSLAYRMLGTREEAEDALQDAFLKLHRNIGKYRFDAAFASWFYRIVANACYDRLRKRKRAGEVGLDTVPETGIEEHSDLRVYIQKAINDLPPQLKACFVLHVQEGFKMREVAEMLGTREGTVKAHIFRAKARLRDALAPRLRGFICDEMS